LTFRATYAAANGGVADTDVLTVAAQNIALNSGTIVDTGTAVNSGVAIPANTVSLTASA
jgi:S1-C subfamily serine protease